MASDGFFDRPPLLSEGICTHHRRPHVVRRVRVLPSGLPSQVQPGLPSRPTLVGSDCGGQWKSRGFPWSAVCEGFAAESGLARLKSFGLRGFLPDTPPGTSSWYSARRSRLARPFSDLPLTKSERIRMTRTRCVAPAAPRKLISLPARARTALAKGWIG